MQLIPTIADRLMSTGPSFPSGSVQTLFFNKAISYALKKKIGLGTRLREGWTQSCATCAQPNLYTDFCTEKHSKVIFSGVSEYRKRNQKSLVEQIPNVPSTSF